MGGVKVGWKEESGTELKGREEGVTQLGRDRSGWDGKKSEGKTNMNGRRQKRDGCVGAFGRIKETKTRRGEAITYLTGVMSG